MENPPGVDSITAELLKAPKELSAAKVHQLLEKVWKHEKIPDKWKRGLIIKLPKKGNLKECKNWRGITLLSVVGKILGRIVIDQIRNGVDIRLRNEQAGYRKGRGTTEQIFILTLSCASAHLRALPNMENIWTKYLVKHDV